jgi:phosphoribosylformylglycinamidine cyclo-ligase
MTTYREAGVDIDAAEETVDRIRDAVQSTYTSGVLADIGAFGGLFALDTERYEEPVLVSSIDGVGTKLKVAFRAQRYDTIGQDLVNHCVNDIAVCGADPLFFLDYFSTGTLEPSVAEQVISGFTTACKANGCALIGGEIAEMPDIYAPGEFDLAGSMVGIVDKPNIIDGRSVSPGDVLIGLPSSGIHTNGFSLARKVLFETYTVDDAPEDLSGRTLGEELLTVHRSYRSAIQSLRTREGVHAFAHITGGGIEGNTSRVVPEEASVAIDWNGWKRPAIFGLIQQLGEVPEDDMRRTFNLGIGLVAIVDETASDVVLEDLRGQGEQPVVIGRVVN